MTLKKNLIKRLKMRSWRRGMKEMDIILGKFIDHSIDFLTDNEIESYENLLNNDDQTIFSWILNKEQKFLPLLKE